MDTLNLADVAIFDYRGLRDPIAPVGSCRTSERWGRKDDGNLQLTCGGLNRTIERNVGHIFVVSKRLLGEFMESVTEFLLDQPPAYVPNKKADAVDPCPPAEVKAAAPVAEVKAEAPVRQFELGETVEQQPKAKPAASKKKPPAK